MPQPQFWTRFGTCSGVTAFPSDLGAAGIRAELETPERPCPRCGGPTEVQKSVHHRVVTLEHGDIIAQETIRVCKARCRQPSGELVTERSDALAPKVPPIKVHGYELEVHDGIERLFRKPWTQPKHIWRLGASGIEHWWDALGDLCRNI